MDGYDEIDDNVDLSAELEAADVTVTESGTVADTDGDGVNDLVGLDTDDDGVLDFFHADTDGDGKLDYIQSDNTGDGLMDYSARDLDGDGQIDYVREDTDGDGYRDALRVDTDGDGEFDVVMETTDIESGQFLDEVTINGETANLTDTDTMVEFEDTDGDGEYNLVGHDVDGDGVADVWREDADGDGYFETRIVGDLEDPDAVFTHSDTTDNHFNEVYIKSDGDTDTEATTDSSDTTSVNLEGMQGPQIKTD